MSFKPFIAAAAVLALACGGLSYASFRLKGRLETSLQKILPGARVSWGYIIAVPLVGKVYAGNIRLYVEEPSGAQKPVAEIASVNGKIRLRERASQGGLQTLDAECSLDGLRVGLNDWEFSADRMNADFLGLHLNALSKKPDTPEEPADLLVRTIAADNVRFRHPNGRHAVADRVSGAEIAARISNADLQNLRQSAARHPWDTLLRLPVEAKVLRAEGLVFSGDFGELLRQDITLQLKSGPEELYLAFGTTVHGNDAPASDPQDTPRPPSKDTPKDTSGKSRFRRLLGTAVPKIKERLRLVGEGFTLRLSLTVPWRASQAKTRSLITVDAPNLFEVELDGSSTAPDITTAANWANACMRFTPPFFDDMGDCAGRIAFDEMTLTTADKGLLKQAGKGRMASSLLSGALQIGGKAARIQGLFGALLASSAAGLHGGDTPSGAAVRVRLSGVNGPMYPLRSDFADALRDGRIKKEISYPKP